MNSYNNLRLRANISKGREDRLGPPKSMGRGPARSSLPEMPGVGTTGSSFGRAGYQRSCFSGFLEERLAKNDLLDESLHAITIVDRGLGDLIESG